MVKRSGSPRRPAAAKTTRPRDVTKDSSRAHKSEAIGAKAMDRLVEEGKRIKAAKVVAGPMTTGRLTSKASNLPLPFPHWTPDVVMNDAGFAIVARPESKCQEASPASKDKYVACGAPATSVVYHEKEHRGYLMCTPCAHHNVRNRGGILLTGPNELKAALPTLTPGPAAPADSPSTSEPPVICTPDELFGASDAERFAELVNRLTLIKAGIKRFRDEEERLVNLIKTMCEGIDPTEFHAPNIPVVRYSFGKNTTLDKGLLLARGVDASIIEACTVVKPYAKLDVDWKVRFSGDVTHTINLDDILENIDMYIREGEPIITHD